MVWAEPGELGTLSSHTALKTKAGSWVCCTGWFIVCVAFTWDVPGLSPVWPCLLKAFCLAGLRFGYTDLVFLAGHTVWLSLNVKLWCGLAHKDQSWQQESVTHLLHPWFWLLVVVKGGSETSTFSLKQRAFVPVQPVLTCRWCQAQESFLLYTCHTKLEFW